MPRYFFHHRVGDRMMWDGAGLDLPDLGLEPASDQATALWVDALTGRVQPDQILVITNDIGQVISFTNEIVIP
jgi:hypothetical protein